MESLSKAMYLYFLYLVTVIDVGLGIKAQSTFFCHIQYPFRCWLSGTGVSDSWYWSISLLVPPMRPMMSLTVFIINAWLLPFKCQKIDISLKTLIDWIRLLKNSASITIIFGNFAVKQLKSIMAKLNRIRVVLAERDMNNKWLSDKLGKDPATVSKWVTNTTQPNLEALIAIANALEVPVQELVRQEEFNQEK